MEKEDIFPQSISCRWQSVVADSLDFPSISCRKLKNISGWTFRLKLKIYVVISQFLIIFAAAGGGENPSLLTEKSMTSA